MCSVPQKNVDNGILSYTHIEGSHITTINLKKEDKKTRRSTFVGRYSIFEDW